MKKFNEINIMQKERNNILANNINISNELENREIKVNENSNGISEITLEKNNSEDKKFKKGKK